VERGTLASRIELGDRIVGITTAAAIGRRQAWTLGGWWTVPVTAFSSPPTTAERSTLRS
jgi:hypothetical protein